MEEKKTLDFGKKYRIGNFVVFKFNKTLKKDEVLQLRNEMGIPDDIRKHLQRAQLPFMKIEAISGIWAVELCCNTFIYQFFDQMIRKAIDAEENEEKLETNSIADFAHIFGQMFMDTTVLGDNDYQKDKAAALKCYIERQKAAEVSDEQDAKTIEDLKADEEAKATIVDMAKHIKEGGEDGGK